MKKLISLLAFLAFSTASAVSIDNSFTLGLGGKFGGKDVLYSGSETLSAKSKSTSGVYSIGYRMWIDTASTGSGFTVAPFVEYAGSFASTNKVDFANKFSASANNGNNGGKSDNLEWNYKANIKGSFSDLNLGFLLGYHFKSSNVTTRLYFGASYIGHYYYFNKSDMNIHSLQTNDHNFHNLGNHNGIDNDTGVSKIKEMIGRAIVNKGFDSGLGLRIGTQVMFTKYIGLGLDVTFDTMFIKLDDQYPKVLKFSDSAKKLVINKKSITSISSTTMLNLIVNF